MIKIQRDQKSNCHFWEAWSKSRVLACPLHSKPPEVGKTPKLASSPGHTLALSSYKEQACPTPWGANKQGNLLIVLTVPSCSRGPKKALPEKKKMGDWNIPISTPWPWYTPPVICPSHLVWDSSPRFKPVHPFSLIGVYQDNFSSLKHVVIFLNNSNLMKCYYF